jgi:competence protein ComEA
MAFFPRNIFSESLAIYARSSKIKVEVFVKSFFNIIAGILIGLIVAAVLWTLAGPPRGDAVILLPPPTEVPIKVYVTGQVARPGLYNLSKDSRVQDAIDAAGGLTDQADVNGVNLAAKLQDGQQVDIPKIPPELSIGTDTSGSSNGSSGGFIGTPININTATEAELETLPGIGPTLAQKIIDYRSAFGFFAKIEDLLNVPGIGPATYDTIKAYITVGP